MLISNFPYLCWILYFLSYRTEVFPFQNNLKNLDPSYKMDLDFLNCDVREKPVSKQNFIQMI